MPNSQPSPRIINIAWGQLTVDGQATPFKDAKLFPGGAREWDWSETGTNHEAGIQPADVEELIDHGARVIVLSQGVIGRLKVSPATLENLKSRGIAVHVLKTEQAVKKYNQLCKSEAVGALIHSTC